MRMIKIAAIALALAAPAVAQAQANPAAKLSVARASAPITKTNKLAGSGILVAILATAAVIAGIVVVADSDDNADSN